MKKTFLVFGLAIGTVAGAQQTDVFDAQQYLQKHPFRMNMDKNAFILPPPIASLNTLMDNPSIPSFQLPNGNHIYFLPQDNMPCIIPDRSQYNYTINASKPRLNQESLKPLDPILPKFPKPSW